MAPTARSYGLRGSPWVHRVYTKGHGPAHRVAWGQHGLSRPDSGMGGGLIGAQTSPKPLT